VVNHDLWFHGLVALQGAPGEGAPRFRAEVRRLLLAHQARAGDLAGSWDPIGVWDRVGGRIYSTAMAVRALSAP
jgi:hypothetical protein